FPDPPSPRPETPRIWGSFGLPFAYLVRERSFRFEEAPMFCNHCGNALQSEYSVCPYCGSLVQGAVASPNEGRVERHIKIIAILWMIMAGLWVFSGFALLAFGIFGFFLFAFGATLGRVPAPLLVPAVRCVVLCFSGGGVLG